ncbi:DUF6188 family protein [Fodinisporobacter ferrooxydans]|uniref:DUF6188 family protein n=1 Tax=Fodinisporobacter ferrooxydans TaxID=2901836 RepID=A0ABY4CIS1_9BACL|nr:DUF6188 family protein [Alicyclobacillaceae bacterium MYW30-H2]
MPNISFENGSLYIQSFWRLRDKEKIIVGCQQRKTGRSTYEKDAFEEMKRNLIGKSITNVFHMELSSDLIVEFDNVLYLDVYSDSSQYESWQLSGSNGFLLVACPGGGYAFWEPLGEKN